MYMRGKVDITGLRKHYGGKQRNGVCANHHRNAAAQIIKYCLKQLEEQNLVGQVKYETEDGTERIMGKCLTKKGITDMDRIASQMVKDAKKNKWDVSLDLKGRILSKTFYTFYLI